MAPIRTVIMGAAGRDFHDFNVYFRDNPAYTVVAFTATQIPNIEGRVYPVELAGANHPAGIPIYPETALERLLRDQRIEHVVLAYSDLSHEEVMHRASLVLAAGADFCLLGPRHTQLKASKPVVSVCAVRTGAGKSPTSRFVARLLRQWGWRVATVRHPMPYGDLAKQSVQRFSTYEDLDRHGCTIEEREEYEPILEEGGVVFAGVDYGAILHQAEEEADVILWDGGNNDLPFFVPNLQIVVADPFRPGHERTYHPGETNARLADVLVINKVDTAPAENVLAVEQNLRTLNPRASIVKAASPIRLPRPEVVRGKRVLVIEDGPTLTHGGMRFGAGWLAAKGAGAASIVDPRPYASGSIRETFRQFPDIGPVLPAMGYGPSMIQDLEETIRNVEADLVIVGTPIDLGRFLGIDKPVQRARYEFEEVGQPALTDVLKAWVEVSLRQSPVAH